MKLIWNKYPHEILKKVKSISTHDFLDVLSEETDVDADWLDKIEAYCNIEFFNHNPYLVCDLYGWDEIYSKQIGFKEIKNDNG